MVNLSGIIKGLWGRPVNAALVTLRSASKTYTDYTEPDGSYTIDADADTYTVTVTYYLYSSYTQTVTLEVDTVINVALSVKNSIKALAVLGAIAGVAGAGYALTRRRKQK